MKYIAVIILLVGCAPYATVRNRTYDLKCEKIDQCHERAKQLCADGYDVIQSWEDEHVVADESKWDGTDPTYDFQSNIVVRCYPGPQ